MALGIVSVCLVAMTPGQAGADPHECVIEHGTVIINQTGDTWIIQASDGSILSCTSFDIAFFELVQFLQPSAVSKVFNYINGPDPTNINGTLLANGIVFLCATDALETTGNIRTKNYQWG